MQQAERQTSQYTKVGSTKIENQLKHEIDFQLKDTLNKKLNIESKRNFPIKNSDCSKVCRAYEKMSKNGLFRNLKECFQGITVDGFSPSKWKQIGIVSRILHQLISF